MRGWRKSSVGSFGPIPGSEWYANEDNKSRRLSEPAAGVILPNVFCRDDAI